MQFYVASQFPTKATGIHFNQRSHSVSDVRGIHFNQRSHSVSDVRGPSTRRPATSLSWASRSTLRRQNA
jgi:dTDP-4-dehydrorhamnose 3,5-epimerase-like enzyme